MELKKDIPIMASVNEPHRACLFLVDTSSSMRGKSINSVNAELDKFKEEVCRNERIKNILDVAIVEFNTTVRCVQMWCPVEYMQSVNLTADGSSDVSNGLKKAIDMVQERNNLYYEIAGTTPYEPWIVMITDGYFNNSIDEITVDIAKLEKEDKLHLWSFAVEGADISILNKLCGRKVLRLKTLNFSGLFDWINTSGNPISEKFPGENENVVRLPEYADKFTGDWM